MLGENLFHHRLHILIITVVTFLTFYNSVNSGFVGDDQALVEYNIAIRDFRHFPSFFSSSRPTSSYETEWGTYIYRPLRSLSYAVDYALFDRDSRGYHLSNLIWHWMVCLSLYFLALKLTALPMVSLLSATIFSVHPVHVEAVSWISSRADLIGLFFLILSLLTYILYREKPQPRFLLLSVTFSFLAYLGKEAMLSLPGFIVLYDFIQRPGKSPASLIRTRWRIWTLYALVALAYLALRFWATGRMTQAQGWWGGSPYSNFLMMAKVISAYWMLLALPIHLNFHYLVEPVSSILNTKVMISFILILSSAALIFWSYHKEKIVFFLLMWFYIGIIPVSNLVPISFSMMAERFLYMPSMGPIMAVSIGIVRLHQRIRVQNKPRLSILVVVVVCLFLLALATRSIVRNNAYRDNLTFYQTAIHDSPNSPPSHRKLADHYYLRGNLAQAKIHYETALALDPRYAEALIGMALVLEGQNDTAQAITLADEAVSRNPEKAYVRFAAGQIFREAGEIDRARIEWETALKLNPRYSEAYNNLGNYYWVRRDYDQAFSMYVKAIESNPYNAESYYNLANLQESLGDQSEARKNYLRFVELAGPEFQEVVRNLKKRYQDGATPFANP